MFFKKTKLSFPFIREVFSVLKLAVSLLGIYLLCRKCSVRRSVTNNKLRNTPQTSTCILFGREELFLSTKYLQLALVKQEITTFKSPIYH